MFKDFFRRRKKIKELKKNRIQIKINQYNLDFFTTHSICFSKKEKPLVSIIIPVYNQIKFTLNCLHSIQNNLDENIDIEIIVINDNSTDETTNYLEKIEGIKVITNQENKGFLLNVNKGIEQAKGEYIYLLNNDTEVQSGFLTSLLGIFYKKKNVGAVGSMLIYPDGKLQEAGCLIYDNGEIVNLGNKDVVENPHYSFVRKVDYCSGSSLLFKRADNQGNLNLLDEAYIPAYYEETDLCMNLKYRQNLEIYYQPESKIIHFENISYSENNLKKKENLMNKNREIFMNKWKVHFSFPRYYESNNKKYTNLSKEYKKTILVLEQVLPKHDVDSGSRRFTEIMKALVEQGYKVYLAFTYFDLEYDEKYVKYFEQIGVEVIRDFIDRKGKLRKEKEQIKEISSVVDYVWIFRPECFNYWHKKLVKYKFQSTLIYDMLDIHHLRLERELEFLEPTEKRLKNIVKVKEQEFAALELADKVIAISEMERNKLIELGIKPDKLYVVSNIHQLREEQNFNKFSERKGVLFIGGFKHTPNLDAVSFLYYDIMPLVWQKNPEIEVFIIGNNSSEDAQQFTDKRFHILGYVENVSHWFNQVKMSVAPLRYGAGVKGKIGQSLEYKLPVVTTDIGAEGMFLENGETAMIGNSKEEFATAILKLYEDEILWNRISDSSEQSLSPFSIQKLEVELNKIISFN